MGRTSRVAAPLAAGPARSWEGWVRGSCGPGDVVAPGRGEPRRPGRAGHLPRSWPWPGHGGSQLVCGGDRPGGRDRADGRGAAAPVGAVAGPDGGAPGRQRDAPGDVLGYRRGAPAAVRRLAGRPRLGLGPAARATRRHDAGRRAARPVRHGRGRRQRPGGTGRAPASGMGWRRLVGQSRADGPVGGAGPGRRRSAAGGPGRTGRPADGPGHSPLRVGRRTAVRRTVRGRAADGPGGGGAGPGRLHRPQAAQRRRGRGAAGRPRRGGAAARAGGRHRRPAQPGSGAVTAGPGRRGRAGHPGLAAAGDAGRASPGRRAARMAEGGADRHHLRLRLAGRAPRRRRPAARRVDRLGRRRGPDDRVGGPA